MNTTAPSEPWLPYSSAQGFFAFQVADAPLAQNSVAPVVPEAYQAEAMSCDAPDESTYVIESHCENTGVAVPDPNFMFVRATLISPHDIRRYTEFATVVAGMALTTYRFIALYVAAVSYAT